MHCRITLVVLAFASMMALSRAALDVLYVGPGGSDGGTCQSSNTPCATISGALGKSVLSPTYIHLLAGEYTGAGNRNLVGPNNVSLSFIGDTPGAAVVNCGNPSPSAFGFQVGNVGSNTFNVNFTSFRIENCNIAAIRIHQGARVYITDMEFVGNSNPGTYGGALSLVPAQQYLEYSVLVSNSRFTSNSASFGGAIGAYGFDAGSSVTRAPANCRITNSTFTSNSASQWGGAVYLFDPDRQGSVYANGVIKGSSISGSTFTSNSATQNGGAVYIVPSANGAPSQPASPTPDFQDNIFSGNTVSNCEAQCGSAFYMNLQPLWSFARNTFTGNVATGAVAGPMTAGALTLRSCPLVSLDSLTLTDNNATNTNQGSSSGVTGAGLGLFSLVDFDTSLTGTNVFTNNRNFGQYGRAAAIGYGGQGRPYGTFTGATFAGNVAQTEGGALYISNAQGITFENTRFETNAANIGGALYLTGGSVTFTDCEFSYNLLSLSGVAFGGAVYLAGTQATFTQPLFSGNFGYSGAALFIDSIGNTDVEITGGEFSTNRAYGKGGALYVGTQAGATVTGKAYATVVDTNFLYNSAGQGGAIYAESSFSLTVNSAQFIGNLADYTLAAASTSGGAVFLRGQGNTTMAAQAVATFTDVYMDLNVANVTFTAGAIRCDGADLTLNETVLQIQPCCADRCIGCDSICSSLFTATANITCPQKTCPPNVPPPTAAPLPPPGAPVTVAPTNTPAPDFTPPPPTPPATTTPARKKSNKIIGLKPIIFWTCVVGLPALVLISLLIASFVLGMRKPKNKPQSRRSVNYRNNNL